MTELKSYQIKSIEDLKSAGWEPTYESGGSHWFKWMSWSHADYPHGFRLYDRWDLGDEFEGMEKDGVVVSGISEFPVSFVELKKCKIKSIKQGT